jgi:putative hydrolase of HD superfamily
MQRIVDFILEVDKLKSVTRKTRPLGLDRYENSAEHSWQLALFAISIGRFAGPAIDISRVIKMLLVHDIGEIDTGDTMVYVDEGREERKAAELRAVARIFGMLPDGPAEEFLSLWREFDDGNTSEAHFAHAIDRAMPILLNLANNGQSWRDNGISYDRVVRRNEPPIRAGCPPLWEYLEAHLEEASRKGWFGA